MEEGVIHRGEIDSRSIKEVQPADLKGFDRCHFFAGIGGWEVALDLAGWSIDRPVWTGSCPCQPFSGAGKRQGEKDERHLWPEFYRLISQCGAPTIFGEQVTGKVARQWLAAVQLDLETAGYAFGKSDIPAASVGAPHPRQRQFWVGIMANANDVKRWAEDSLSDFEENSGRQPDSPAGPSGSVELVDAAGERRAEGMCGSGSDVASHHARSVEVERHLAAGEASLLDIMADRFDPRQRGYQIGNRQIENPGQAWRDSTFIACADGFWRPIKPEILPLAHGLPGRVGLIRGYGNAIVPNAAAEFVEVFI